MFPASSKQGIQLMNMKTVSGTLKKTPKRRNSRA